MWIFPMDNSNHFIEIKLSVFVLDLGKVKEDYLCNMTIFVDVTKCFGGGDQGIKLQKHIQTHALLLVTPHPTPTGWDGGLILLQRHRLAMHTGTSSSFQKSLFT